MKINRTMGTAAAVVAVAVVGLLAFGTYAFAQSDGGPAASGAERGWGGRHDGRWGPDPDRIREARAELAADLATELDTSPAAVEAAFRAVVVQRAQEAVEAGDIDQEQADDALAAYDDGEVRALFRLLRR